MSSASALKLILNSFFPKGILSSFYSGVLFSFISENHDCICLSMIYLPGNFIHLYLFFKKTNICVFWTSFCCLPYESSSVKSFLYVSFSIQFPGDFQFGYNASFQLCLLTFHFSKTILFSAHLLFLFHLPSVTPTPFNLYLLYHNLPSEPLSFIFTFKIVCVNRKVKVFGYVFFLLHFFSVTVMHFIGCLHFVVLLLPNFSLCFCLLLLFFFFFASFELRLGQDRYKFLCGYGVEQCPL